MSNDKSPTYNIGGVPPYGWTGTPGYNPFQAPTGDETFGEVALYERLDWSGGLDADAAKLQLQNPPFLGVGSTAGRIPSVMAADSIAGLPHRILRGYMRRFDANPASANNASDPVKSFAARLFFMWNPPSIQRKYSSFEDIQSFLNPTNQANGPLDNADTQPFLKTDLSFELFFDRQEEVARFPDHPGVLVDLAVFDLLSRGGSPAGQVTSKELSNFDSSGNVTGTVAGPSSTSLLFNPNIKIAVIFSPYIVYFGNLTDVMANFEKFSHRMTPTRMTLYLSMRLYALGNLSQLRAADLAAVSASASAAAVAAGLPKDVDPSVVTAQTGQQKDRLNIQGARDAMSWGEHWMKGGITPDGIMYNSNTSLRCLHAEDDSYDHPETNIPVAFDCSSFVARCFCVMGWGSSLGITPCSDTNGFEAAAKNKPDAWYVLNMRDRMNQYGQGASGPIMDLVGGQLRAGDCILRSGTGSNGHIAFIHAVLDPGQKYEILHTNATSTPVHIDTYDLRTILQNYTHLLRAEPIRLVKPVVDTTGNAASGNSVLLAARRGR